MHMMQLTTGSALLNGMVLWPDRNYNPALNRILDSVTVLTTEQVEMEPLSLLSIGFVSTLVLDDVVSFPDVDLQDPPSSKGGSGDETMDDVSRMRKATCS